MVEYDAVIIGIEMMVGMWPFRADLAFTNAHEQVQRFVEGDEDALDEIKIIGKVNR